MNRRNDVWCSPVQTQLVINEVETRVKMARVYNAIYDLGEVPREEREIALSHSVGKLASRLTDEYLALGVQGLYNNWSLLVEDPDVSVEGFWMSGGFKGLDMAGASICLAARQRQERVASLFNGVRLEAFEITHPSEIRMQYRRQWDLVRVRGSN